MDILKNEDVQILKQGSIDLLVESYSSVAAILQIRGMAKEQAILADIVTTTDRALQTTVIDITDTPIFLTARTSARAVKRGQLYIKVSMRVDGVVVALLMAGYVAETHKVTYPGGDFEGSTDGPGFLRSITGTNPAAGAEMLETVPTGAAWRVHSVGISFAADATVISRVSRLSIDDGATEIIRSNLLNPLVANITYALQFSKESQVAVISQTGANANCALEIKLNAGYRIKTTTSLMQAGDNYGAPQLLVEEWIQP